MVPHGYDDQLDKTTIMSTFITVPHELLLLKSQATSRLERMLFALFYLQFYMLRYDNLVTTIVKGLLYSLYLWDISSPFVI